MNRPFKLAFRPLALSRHNPTVCSLACRWRLRLALQADQEPFILSPARCLIVGPIIHLRVVLHLLYPTPPSILHLGHHPPWLGYSTHKLVFGQTLHTSWPLGLQPLAITMLQCAASLAAGFYDWSCGPIESLFLLSSACCLIVGSELSYSYCILLHHLSYTSDNNIASNIVDY